jgi:hypothetical protein
MPVQTSAVAVGAGALPSSTRAVVRVATASRRNERLPTARTESIRSSSRTETPAES